MSEPELSCQLPLGFAPRMIDQLPAMIWIDDETRRCVYVNQASLAFTGRLPKDELGLNWIEAMEPMDRERYLQTYEAAAAQRSAFTIEYRMRRHDGEVRSIQETASPLHDTSGLFVGYCGLRDDVTDRRAADAARRDVEEQVRLLSLATHDLVWSWDARSDRVIHNAALGETLGEAPGGREETIAWATALIHEDDRGRVSAIVRQALLEGAFNVSAEYRIRRRDGTWIVVDDRAFFVRDDRGEIVRVIGAMRDISKRRAAEDERERFVRILEATTDVVAMAHPNGVVIHLNEAGRKLLGQASAAAPEEFNLRRFHPAWANEIIFQEGIPHALAEGSWSGETALLTTAGDEVPVLQLILAHPGADGKVEFVSTIMRDISERKRAEIARIEAGNRYEAAIRSSGQVLFDWNSVTNEVNYAGDLELFLGYTTKEMAGGLDRFRELVHPDDVAAFDAEIGRVIATREPFRLTYRMRRKNNREVIINAQGHFFLDRQGHYGRMVGFLADITAQQQAQDALARAHDGLEHRVIERTAELARANAVIHERVRQQEAVADLGQRALAGAPVSAIFREAAIAVRDRLNVEYCSVLELTEDKRELIAAGGAGWPDDDAYSRVPIGLLSQSGYTLLMREPVMCSDLETETRFRVSDSVRWVGGRSAISVTIHAGEEPIGVLIAIATKQRSFTKDDVHFLQSVANILTAAVTRQRAEENIRIAHEQAETANRAKSEFLSRMSHELRTPLNAILGFTQLLEMDSPTPSQAESVAHISRGGAHLLGLINQVLDIARIDTGKLALTPENVDLGEVLREAIVLIQPLAARHEITIHLDPSCESGLHALADRQRLRQVFHNLLSNAAKYDKEGGDMFITGDRVGPAVRIHIRDTGPGIPPEKMSRLFVPFERLGAELTTVEGTGIGLALAHRIITSLGGTLTATSVPGEGSTFTVEFQALGAQSEVTPAAPSPVEIIPATTVRTVLYIEDQDLNLRLVERILKREPDLRLISAMQGSLGLELAREHRPDVILLDLNLPDLSGDEILRRLKADPDLREIPVIMVSADAIGDRIEKLLGLGAHNYITKPYKVQDFLRILNEVLNGSPA